MDSMTPVPRNHRGPHGAARAQRFPRQRVLVKLGHSRPSDPGPSELHFSICSPTNVTLTEKDVVRTQEKVRALPNPQVRLHPAALPARGVLSLCGEGTDTLQGGRTPTGRARPHNPQGRREGERGRRDPRGTLSQEGTGRLSLGNSKSPRTALCGPLRATPTTRKALGRGSDPHGQGRSPRPQTHRRTPREPANTQWTPTALVTRETRGLPLGSGDPRPHPGGTRGAPDPRPTRGSASLRTTHSAGRVPGNRQRDDREARGRAAPNTPLGSRTT